MKRKEGRMLSLLSRERVSRFQVYNVIVAHGRHYLVIDQSSCRRTSAQTQQTSSKLHGQKALL